MVEGSTASDADYGRDWRHLPLVIIGLVFFLVSECALVNDLTR